MVISAARQEVMEASLELTASVMPAWVNRGHFSDINASSAMALSLNVMSAAAAACCNIPEDMQITKALDLYASLFKQRATLMGDQHVAVSARRRKMRDFITVAYTYRPTASTIVLCNATWSGWSLSFAHLC